MFTVSAKLNKNFNPIQKKLITDKIKNQENLMREWKIIWMI